MRRRALTPPGGIKQEANVGPELGTDLAQLFLSRAAARGPAPFVWAKHQGRYTPWSWERVEQESRDIAAALASAGLQHGDRVLLVAENRPEWCIADLAILRAGGITVPAYTTNTPDDHGYILQHSGARFVVASGATLAKRLMPAVAQAPQVRLVLFMDPTGGWAVPQAEVHSWEVALARGRATSFVDHAGRLSADDVACLIYTSGTGGRPKGVMLSHRNIMANLRGAWSLVQQLGCGEGAVFLSFLPLSHAYEHTAGQFLPIALGGEIYYAEGVDTLSRNLVEARPHLLPCVPRLYEVMRLRILHGVDHAGGLKAQLFHKAVALGAKRYETGRLNLAERLLDMVLERVVREPVRARFGGRLKALISGGAALDYQVGLFFTALGLPVAQGYGQTEAAPLISVNPPWRSRLHTVGPPVEGVELRIADDGEILVRGEMVMRGYWNDPPATAAALEGGWLHTGDIGEIEPDGYLKITDRKKDIIVLSGGDNVAPQRVEGTLLLESEIAQAAVFGDKRPYLVALLTPNPELTRDGHNAELLQNRMAAAVARANARLSTIQRVRRWALMPEPCTVDNGLMTPTLKLKRHALRGRYAQLIEDLYEGGHKGG
jgi:long-chain acyl-CoA synthetase